VSTQQSQTASEKLPEYRDFVRIKYIPSWIFLGIVHIAGLIPLRMHYPVGYLLGKLLLVVVPSRKHVCEVNLRKCFPEYSESEIQSTVKKAYTMYGMGVLQTAFSWTRDSRQLEKHFRVEGLECLIEAQEKDRGVLLMCGHFTLLDLAGRLLGRHVQFDVLQRKHNNPLINLFITRGREKFGNQIIARLDMRVFVKRLRAGSIIAYPADQDLGAKDSVFVPFFGIPTATITATSKILKLTHSEVIGSHYYRDPIDKMFVLQFEPIPIPTGDPVEDASIFNQWIEGKIRQTPEQYFWLHKRFKTRPQGEASFY
jgi:KDO2-lipid IV(A) lauroyltransferase